MKSVLAIMILIGGSAFAQTHTGAMLDLPNAFTNTDSFSLGITVGPITFSQLAGISNSTTIIYITDGSQTNPCTGSGSGALAIRINGAWSCASGAGTGTVTSIATTGPITGGTITATGTIACATCVTASSPGAGVAHFAGSTQAVTSSAVVGADCPTCALQSSVQNQSYVYASGGGTTNAQTVTLSPAVGSLVVGQYACWLPSNANASTTPTLAVNGLTAKTITKAGGAALAASDLTTTAIACVIYDGTNYELQNPQTGGGGAVGSKTVNIPFDQCTPAQTTNGGNSFYTTIAFTNWDAGVWSFVLNTAADIFCSIKIPHNVNASPAALIIFDVSANDATASHTDVFSTTDAISSSKNLQVGSLSAGSPSTCTFTTTATAYAVTECSITPAATIAADQYLVVKIHQAASSSVTANVVMPSPMLQLLEDF